MLLRLDTIPAVAFVNMLKGTVSQTHQNSLRTVVVVQWTGTIADDIPGALQTNANEEWQVMKDGSGWMPNEQFFHEIQWK